MYPWLASRYPLKWLLTVRRILRDYTGEEVLPELKARNLKTFFGTNSAHVKAALPLTKEELVNGRPTSQVVVSSKMYHGHLRWLHAEIDEQSASSSDFQSPWKIWPNQHEEMFETFNMGIGLMLAGQTRKCGTCQRTSWWTCLSEIGRIKRKMAAWW